MSVPSSIHQQVVQNIWKWIHEFVTVPNACYDYQFAPCPFAHQAVLSRTVDVKAWRMGGTCEFIKENAIRVRDDPSLTTCVMALPPRMRFQFAMHDFVESLNVEMVSDNVFLNTGLATTTTSRYPGSRAGEPYAIVVANSLKAVLSGSEALAKTDYYKGWPADHYAYVVERRTRLAKRYGDT